MGLLKLTKKGWDKMYKIYDSFDKQKQNSIDMTGMLNELLSNTKDYWNHFTNF